MLVATRSTGKLRELLPWFAAIGVTAESLHDAGIPVSAEEEGLEAFDTFEANALAKARWFHAQSDGRVVVSDDSGLEVAALAGAPGVRSKRWSGRPDLDGAALDRANNAHLQAMLRQASDGGCTSKRAQYVCAAACVWSHGEMVVRGITAGVIAPVPRGGGGFGYDRYFVSDELGMTFGEATRQEKSRVSHRGRAFERLIGLLWEPGCRIEFPVGQRDGG